jgi:methylene-tetrahydromethanopterin dehydrogenase
MAYDAGFHAVIPYGNVDEETGTLLIQDIIFSRGPKGAKFTALFVGGDDLEAAEKVRAAAVKSMFPPFQISVMIDPKGAYAVVIGSRSRESAERLAKAIGEKAGGTVTGAQMGTDEEKTPILKGVDLILSTAKAGVQILSQSVLEALPPGKVVADVNAVPPSGVVGLEPEHDLKEIAPGIRGIGAIAIGVLKYDVEMEMLETILRDGDRQKTVSMME